MTHTVDWLSPWAAPEFKARLAELLAEGKCEDAAWMIAANDLYPVVWTPPAITRQ